MPRITRSQTTRQVASSSRGAATPSARGASTSNRGTTSSRGTTTTTRGATTAARGKAKSTRGKTTSSTRGRAATSQSSTATTQGPSQILEDASVSQSMVSVSMAELVDLIRSEVQRSQPSIIADPPNEEQIEDQGLLPHLNSIPPPSSLTSVSVIPPINQPSSTTLSNTGVTTLMTGSLGPSFNQPNPLMFTPQYPLPALLPGSQGQPGTTGLILSPAAEPIPANLVQKIRAGQFVEMRDLLADNISLLHQLSTLQGQIPLSHCTTPRPRLREVPSLASWLYCFNTYVAIRTTDPIARDMLSYSRLLIREALSHGGQGWLDYDRVFRKQAAINPGLQWNSLVPSLHASTIFSRRSQSGTFCTLCRECDHSDDQCALYTMEQPLRRQSTSQTTMPDPRRMVPGSGARPAKRPESLLHICIGWNKGTCSRPQSTYRHVCATCQLPHKAKDCSATPESSQYKTRYTAPYPTPVPTSSGR